MGEGESIFVHGQLHLKHNQLQNVLPRIMKMKASLMRSSLKLLYAILQSGECRYDVLTPIHVTSDQLLSMLDVQCSVKCA